MKRTFLLALASAAGLWAQMDRVYIGGYSDSIYMAEFDPKTGDLTHPVAAIKSNQPSFLTLSPDKRFLYAVNETNDGRVSGYTVSKRDGTLIDVTDHLGVHKRDPRKPGLLFEAAWTPRGAVYLEKPRFGGETLTSLVATCPDRLGGHTALDAPGLNEQAAELTKQAEKLQSELDKVRAQAQHAADVVYFAGRQPIELHRSIDELQEQIQQLRKEVGELRELLQRQK